ncbi:DUF2997 domain-containing protein [Pseudoclavibacter sp. CFCC 13796]|uniref:DUF2997 domain-containing protein n=1 Tax=Pseudoclavibacter sp. CFCC 13796 TaxID=2615179 RepID=UPI0013012BC0|nr:DUF2997 domain-containing protein [Pseudoclavibacter sp. CFCC 13796]
MSRRLSISIAPDGSINADVSGAPGPACLESLATLRQVLNADIADSKPTPEFGFRPNSLNNDLAVERNVEERI